MREMTFKELRLKNKLTQEQVAEKSGFSKDYISMIERGERNPSDKAKAIFAEIFNVPIVQIFLATQRTISTTQRKEA
jgi:transcriptional regulator with XRE-family HTH domain